MKWRYRITMAFLGLGLLTLVVTFPMGPMTATRSLAFLGGVLFLVGGLIILRRKFRPSHPNASAPVERADE